MLVLGIETATDVCAVGLVEGDRALADFAVLRLRQHGARLAGLVSAVLEASGAAPQDLDAIAVSAGPGSYTGLRIGLSTAKGLCLASGASLVAVSTLHALASGAQVHDGAMVITALPSRRGEVYAAAYRVSGSDRLVVKAPVALAVADLSEWVPASDRIAVVGPAAKTVIDQIGGSAREVEARASGLTIAQIGRERLKDGHVEDMAAFEPAYLKPFISGGA